MLFVEFHENILISENFLFLYDSVLIDCMHTCSNRLSFRRAKKCGYGDACLYFLDAFLSFHEHFRGCYCLNKCTATRNIISIWISCSVASVVSHSVRPNGQQPTRLLCARDSPGKNTGVGCCFPLPWMSYLK